MDGWLEGWLHGQMDGRMNRHKIRSRRSNAILIVQYGSTYYNWTKNGLNILQNERFNCFCLYF